MTTPRAVAPQSLVKTQTRFFKTALTDRPYADPIGTPEVRISRFSQHPQPASPAATHRTTIPLELLSLHSFKVFYTSVTHSLTHSPAPLRRGGLSQYKQGFISHPTQLKHAGKKKRLRFLFQSHNQPTSLQSSSHFISPSHHPPHRRVISTRVRVAVLGTVLKTSFELPMIKRFPKPF